MSLAQWLCSSRTPERFIVSWLGLCPFRSHCDSFHGIRHEYADHRPGPGAAPREPRQNSDPSHAVGRQKCPDLATRAFCLETRSTRAHDSRSRTPFWASYPDPRLGRCTKSLQAVPHGNGCSGRGWFDCGSRAAAEAGAMPSNREISLDMPLSRKTWKLPAEFRSSRQTLHRHTPRSVPRGEQP